MSKNAEFLEKHGWKRISRKKHGCLIVERWEDTLTAEIYDQTTALSIQRDRNYRARLITKPVKPESWIHAGGKHR